MAAIDALLGDKTSHDIFRKGLNGSGAALAIASLFARRKGRYVCVLNDLEEAGYFYHDIRQLTGADGIYFFPSAYRRAIKYGHIDPANEIARTEVLSKLQDAGDAFVIVSYPDALAERIVASDVLKDNTLKLSVGEKVDNMFVADVLEQYGFEQVDYVYEPGQYALRGSILDVFSYSYEFPYRIDFFGNEVETIRSFDVETQLSKEKMESIYIVPEMSNNTKTGGSLLSAVPADTLVVAKDLAWCKERVGGGYGSKQDILVEDLCGYATWITGKPVYYRNSREEEFIANSTRHPMRLTVKMAGKKDGTITGIYMDVRANTGPYGNHCLTVPMNASSKTLPLFKVDNMYYDLNTYYSNIPPAGAYQGYGAPKGYFAIMSCMDELAHKLGVDSLEMALKNVVDEGYMLEILKGLGEGREGNVVPVGSCGVKEALRKGAEMIGWGHREVSDDPDWAIGKGFAMIQQGSGLPGLDQANAQCKLLPDGSFVLLSGGADIGTGLDTISAKIVCELMCVAPSRVTVVSGDTDSCLFDTGAYASSGTYFSGNASLNAVKDLKAKVLAEAALQLGEEVDDLELRAPGEVHSKRTDRILGYAKLSHDALAGDGRGAIIGTGSFATANSAIPYGAHFAQVAVNRRTGEIKVQKFYALQDAGTPINPELALCQMYGAAMKSIGHTLYEDMVLDKDGRCLSADFTDYGVPMVGEAPEDFKAVLIDVDDQYGPFGAKSISEIATNGAAPAIANAIYDAVGVRVRSWPITPEKILHEMGKF